MSGDDGFEVFSQRYKRGATIVTSNLPFVEWTSVLGSHSPRQLRIFATGKDCAGGFVAEGAGPILPFRILASPIVGPLARQFMAWPMVRRLLRQSYGNPGKVSDEFVSRYFETINGAGHRASLGARLIYLMSYQPVSLIDALQTPTLIMWGDRDKSRPVLYASMFHERIKGSVLRVHRGIGHFPMEEAPEATVLDAREFMRGVR